MRRRQQRKEESYDKKLCPTIESFCRKQNCSRPFSFVPHSSETTNTSNPSATRHHKQASMLTVVASYRFDLLALNWNIYIEKFIVSKLPRRNFSICISPAFFGLFVFWGDERQLEVLFLSCNLHVKSSKLLSLFSVWLLQQQVHPWYITSSITLQPWFSTARENPWVSCTRGLKPHDINLHLHRVSRGVTHSSDLHIATAACLTTNPF